MSAMVAIITAWASVACYAAAALGSSYALFAAVAAWRFAATRDGLPADLPPVTILKPLHGAEPD
ncbi:MAG: glucosyltransferase, partial [Xanthobacteraceae bacterium]